MLRKTHFRVSVRDAAEADVRTLTSIKGDGGDRSEAIHRDRLRDAQSTDFRYLVFMVDGECVAHALLIFRRPANWSDADDPHHLPQIVDLQVKKSHRGQGYGSQFILAIERIAAEAGHDQLFMSVEPLANPRAYALYRRLGYRQIQPESYRKVWAFTDSAGKVHRGEDWVVEMVKQLPERVTDLNLGKREV